MKMTNRYTEEHLSFIRENIVNTEKDLVEMFNKRFDIKLTKGKLRNLKSKLKITSGLKGGQFQKGQQSFNKGKKWSEYMPKQSQEKSRRTCFKKGNIPQNHRPVGSERINVDGYIEVKVAEPNKWKLKHRLIWEKEYGVIPKGFNVVFLDKNRENCAVDNLQLVSWSQNLIMNQKGYFTESKEITEAGIATTKLYEKIQKLIK